MAILDLTIHITGAKWRKGICTLPVCGSAIAHTMRAHAHTRTRAHTRTSALSLFLSLAHPHSHSRFLSLFAVSLTLFLSLKHTHTRTLTTRYTQNHTRARIRTKDTMRCTICSSCIVRVAVSRPQTVFCRLLTLRLAPTTLITTLSPRWNPAQTDRVMMVKYVVAA